MFCECKMEYRLFHRVIEIIKLEQQSIVKSQQETNHLLRYILVQNCTITYFTISNK